METRHEVIFGEIGMFRMFNVEIDGKGSLADPIRKPLWKIGKHKLSRGEKAALQSEDTALTAVKIGKPGSQERIAAYAKAIEDGQLLFTDSYHDENENECDK